MCGDVIVFTTFLHPHDNDVIARKKKFSYFPTFGHWSPKTTMPCGWKAKTAKHIHTYTSFSFFFFNCCRVDGAYVSLPWNIFSSCVCEDNTSSATASVFKG